MQRITRSTITAIVGITVALLLPSTTKSLAAEVAAVAAPDGAKPVCARIDDAGTIHLLCDSSNGPLYARSRDGGKSFDLTLPVVDRAARKPGLEFTVWDAAVAPDGRVHVALGTNAWKLKLPQEEWGFYYTHPHHRDRERLNLVYIAGRRNRR